MNMEWYVLSTEIFIELITAYIQHLRHRIYFYIVLFHFSQSILNSLIYIFLLWCHRTKTQLAQWTGHKSVSRQNSLPTHLVRQCNLWPIATHHCLNLSGIFYFISGSESLDKHEPRDILHCHVERRDQSFAVAERAER